MKHPPDAEAQGLPWGGKGGEADGHPPIQADTEGPLLEHGLGGAAVLEGVEAAGVARQSHSVRLEVVSTG